MGIDFPVMGARLAVERWKSPTVVAKQLRRSLRKEIRRIDQVADSNQPRCPRCPVPVPPVLEQRGRQLVCLTCLWGEGGED